jgi:rubredoxin
MPEALPFDDMHDWTRTLPNGTTVRAREFRWQGPFAGRDDLPQCFVVDQPPGSTVEPHFHIEDEFQLVVAGGGRLGRHPVEPLAIHYSGAYTPYGPIVAGREGIRYFTLRAKRDPGAKFLPAERDQMKPAPKRFYMAGESLRPSPAAALAGLEAPRFVPLIEETAERVGVFLAEAGPGGRIEGPDPAGTGGQYLVVTAGSAEAEGRRLGPYGTAFVAPGEPALAMTAGPEGAQVVVMQFPERHVEADLIVAPAAERWHCPLCGFVYDEAEGLEIDGIPAGTRFADIEADWTCPNCDAAKAEFEALGR